MHGELDVTISPLSGKHGFLRWSTSSTYIPIPIYSWTFSSRNIRPTYRTSRSLNLPVRTGGILEEILVVRGVHYEPVGFFTSLFTASFQSFEIGWYNLGTGKKVWIPIVSAALQEFRVEFIYTQTNQPTFVWTAVFTGIGVSKTFTEAIANPDDFTIVCPELKGCQRTITSTDSSMPLLQHIRNATVLWSFIRPKYRTSRSNHRFADQKDVFDLTANLTVEGNFDYWLSLSQLDVLFFTPARTYSFYASSTVSFGNLKMRITSIDNINVNIETGEIVSANVNLGAAYG